MGGEMVELVVVGWWNGGMVELVVIMEMSLLGG